MTEPVWLTVEMIIDIHAEQLSIFGGPAGIRDHGLPDSALGRARNRHAYGEVDLPDLAAAYAFGIAHNHPFVDGNKRAAFAAIIVFLGLNERRLTASPAEATVMILGLAAGEVSEESLARWIRDHLAPGAGP